VLSHSAVSDFYEKIAEHRIFFDNGFLLPIKMNPRQSSITKSTISNTMTTTAMTTTLSSEREKEESKRQQDETQRLHESFRRQHSTGHNRSAVSSRREPRQRLF